MALFYSVFSLLIFGENTQMLIAHRIGKVATTFRVFDAGVSHAESYAMKVA